MLRKRVIKSSIGLWKKNGTLSLSREKNRLTTYKIWLVKITNCTPMYRHEGPLTGQASLFVIKVGT